MVRIFPLQPGWGKYRIDFLTYRPTIQCGDRVTPADRVPPAELHGHCMAENLSMPCCFCPLTDSTKPALVEAWLLVANEGIHAGEYVAKCADNLCGYFGASRNLLIDIKY